MFTFSFSSAFATTTFYAKEISTGYTYTYEQALNLVTDTLASLTDAAQKKLTSDVAAYAKNIAVEGVTISKDAYKAVCEDAYDEYVKRITVEAQKQLNNIKTAHTADSTATFEDKYVDVQNTTGEGYTVTSAYTSTGVKYVLSTVQLKEAATFSTTSLSELALIKAEFAVVKEAQATKIAAIDTSVYSTTVMSNKTTYQEAAAKLINDALAQISATQIASGDDKIVIAGKVTDLAGLYTAAVGAGDPSGVLYTSPVTSIEVNNNDYTYSLATLLKVKVEVKDNNKVDYAKKTALALAKSLISGNEATVVNSYESAIFTEELKTTPNQTTIKGYNAGIEAAKKLAANELEVIEYWFANASATIGASGDVVLYYDLLENDEYDTSSPDETILTIGSYTADAFTAAWSDYSDLKDAYEATLASFNSHPTVAQLCATVDALEKYAAQAKAGVAVDGSVAIDVDKNLADAIEATYMRGSTSTTFNVTSSADAVHARIHELLGSSCSSKWNSDEVTVNGKDYDTVNYWASANNYDKTKRTEVKVLQDTATDELEAAETIADAEAIFLKYFAQYDEVMTSEEHTALFVYNGALYKQYNEAVAEINAYIDYKIGLMGAKFAGDTDRMKAYFAAAFKNDVYSAQDLTAALAAAKTTVDNCKTKATIDEEVKALYNDVVAVTVPVTTEQKDAIVALAKKYEDLFDYVYFMVGYNNATLTTAGNLIEMKLQAEMALDIEAMQKLVVEIEKDAKVTLDDKANVEALAKAWDAYFDLYFKDLSLTPGAVTQIDLKSNLSYYMADCYEAKIFELEVADVYAKIAALPLNATTAQVLEVKNAVKALGFDGICALSDEKYYGALTKLNAFETSAKADSLATVESAKLVAKSSAKKGLITVTWNAAEGADGYVVYRCTKATGKYTKMYTTTKTTYKNNKNLKKGTKYYYKVKAYKTVDGVKVWSQWSTLACRVAK